MKVSEFSVKHPVVITIILIVLVVFGFYSVSLMPTEFMADLTILNAIVLPVYPDASAARKTLDILNKLYPFRKCKNMPNKTCLYYHIKQCLGPCEYSVDPKIYENMANNVILCFDGDAAGEKATISAIELLEDTGVNIKIVRLPDNLDPDEYILKNGKDSFLAQINNASNLIDYKMEILKKNKDFGNIKDISSYVNSALKELINEKDNIIVELNLKKLSDNFNIDYETIKDKYNKLIKNKKEVVRDIKPKKTYNKYGMAENYLIYYMLKNEKVLNMVENRVGYFPDKNIRELSNEIIYYFHKYGIINVADFISYISDREEILRTLRDIIAMGIKEDFQIEEIEDYIFVINEYHKEVRVNNLNKKLKEEKDPLKQAKISMEIMKIRGGSKNGIRN